MNYVKGKISELFDKLPAGVQSFIYDPATDEKIESIGKKHSLNKSQIDNLTDEAQYVIIGYKPQEELAASIQKNTGVPGEISRLLALDVSEQIIKPARELAEKPKPVDDIEEIPELIDNPTEEVDERYKELPEDVREAITSVGVAEKIAELAKKYRLHIDKADELSGETGLVMLGLTHPKDYMNNLRTRLELPEDTARALVADVNEEIFLPIRESLKKIHDIERSREESRMENGTDGSSFTGNAPAPGNGGKKTLGEAGIEIEPRSLPLTEMYGDKVPQKSDLIETLENPGTYPKGEPTLPAGFSLSRGTPSAINPVIPPERKLETTVRLPPTESIYEEKAPSVQSLAREKPNVDPYREPIS